MVVANPHGGFSGSSSTKKPTRPTRPTTPSDYFGSMYTTSGGSGSTTSSSSNTQVNPNNPTVAQSIDDRKTAYESMREAGMLTPSLSGISLYDKSPVIYEPGTTTQDILGADDPTDIGGQQVDLTGTKVDGLTPFYSTYADDAMSTGNVSYKARMFALSQGATEEEAQAVADQASNELKRLVSEARSSGDYSAMDQFFAGQNEFFKSILPQTIYGGKDEFGRTIGAGGYTGSPTNYVGMDEKGQFFDIDDPTPGILSNRSGFGGGGGGSYGGGGGDYAAGIAAGLGRRPKQLGDEENVPKGLRLLQYMVNLHKENPYTKMALRKKSGGIVSLVGG
jgi:hypothetical protein